jgi:diguanylate cyclase (GGDEF)-like protein/PAS domain S-box-containing protein
MFGPVDPHSLLNSIYESAIDFGIATFDTNRIVTSWNLGAERIMGFTAKEIIGQEADIIFTPEDRQNDIPEKECQTALLKGRAADYRWHLRRDCSRFWADGVLTPIYNDLKQHMGYLKILRDITERKLAENEIRRLANFDTLTGLANRFYFELQLREMIAMSQRSGQLLILHALDLDRFKEINDTLGHHAGDELLKQAAQRLQWLVRDTDLVARIGGDEFMILQPGMSTVQAGGDLANKILEALSAPFQIEHHELQIGCTIGIAVCPIDANEPEQLVRRADRALYRAKDDSRGTFQYFTASLDLAAHRRARNLSALRRASRNRDFWLAYQPKIDGPSEKTVGVEVLLRFNNPQLSSLPLMDLINLATESGLMPDISLWVLREACLQVRKWQQAGQPALVLCVNFCSRELMDPHAPETIEAVLMETSLEANRLEIEITERQAIEIGKAGIENLKTLRRQGISIALDDFGTGYSALSYLTALPVNTVKLDQTFLGNVPQDGNKSIIATAIIRLIQALQLRVVAEGVESHDQVDFLRSENCNALQGFYYTKPLSADGLTAWFTDNPQVIPQGAKPH